MVRKQLSELTIADDFMFARVMSTPAIAHVFLEEVLEVPIEKVVVVEEQHGFKDKALHHGVRFDVYIRDGKGTVYNVEMQKTRKYFSAERVRFYHSTIDSELLKEGQDYQTLAKTFVIFVCQFDPFPPNGLIKYTISKVVDELGQEFVDGQHTILLNTAYDRTTLQQGSTEVRRFLDYIQDPLANVYSTSSFVHTVQQRVIEIREDAMTRRDYMSLEEMIEEREEAAAAKAALETKKSIAKELLGEFSQAQVAKVMKMSLEDLQVLLGSTNTNSAVKKMHL